VIGCSAQVSGRRACSCPSWRRFLGALGRLRVWLPGISGEFRQEPALPQGGEQAPTVLIPVVNGLLEDLCRLSASAGSAEQDGEIVGCLMVSCGSGVPQDVF